MRAKLLFSFLLIVATGSGYAKNIDFCKTIEFDTGSFNYSVIEKASSNSECRERPIPIQYNGVKDTFNLTSQANPTGGASYLTWDESSQSYGYDKDELKSTIHDIVDGKKSFKYIEALTPVVKIKYTPRENGGVVVSDVVFKDEKNNPVSMVRDVYFYSRDNYAAVYSSEPIKCSQKIKVDFINEVESLFESMSINW